MALARGRLFVASTFEGFDYWAQLHGVTLAVNAWWDNPYQWFQRSQASHELRPLPFKVCWVNYDFSGEQQVERYGPNLSPCGRLEVAMRCIARHLHMVNGVVVIFCKTGIHQSGSLVILVLALLDEVLAHRGLAETRSCLAKFKDKCKDFGVARHLSEQGAERGGDLWNEVCGHMDALLHC